MTVARCDDPNCSCRSPDLQWFTNQVLRRDAAKTDYIVIPLIAGVLARCLIAESAVGLPAADEPGQRELHAQARAVADLTSQPLGGETWEDDLHAYGIIADLLFCNWPALLSWVSVSYQCTTLGLSLKRRSRDVAPAALRFLASTPAPSWTESVMIAVQSSMSATAKSPELEIFGRGGRPFRVVLADRLRREGLVTWPRVLSAAVNDWTVPTLEHLARHHAAAGDAAIRYVMDLGDDEEEPAPGKATEVVPASNPESTGDPQPGKPAGAGDDGESAAAEHLIEEAVAEIEHWRLQRDRVQRERDLFAGRDARSRSRAESLERELKAARLAQERLERELRTAREERDRLAEQLAAHEAVADVTVPTALPANLFAGRRVLVFTGVENAEVRAALAQGFWDLGAAQVDCYWTDKARGPDVFPAEAIIVADVTFMSHSEWGSIQDRARAAGAWHYWGKHGAATLSRAVAAAWSKHLER
jgi:hypothetical protein